MCFLSTLAGSIKIALLISLDDHGENLAIEFELGFHPFILCADDGGFCCPEHDLRLLANVLGGEHPNGAEFDLLHLDDRMPLVVPDGIVTDHVLVNKILQLQQGGSFMSADIAKVVRTRAAQCHGTRIPVFLYMHLVESAVIVVFDPKTYSTEKIVVFNEFNVSYRMNLFSTTDDFVRSVVVNEFQ
jgi:hypothetical protein